MEELKISEQLAGKLENEGIKSSVEGLIDYKKMVDEYLTKDNLTDEEKKIVSDKLESIVNYYQSLNDILKNKKSNELKVEKIKELLSQIGIEELGDIQTQIDKIFNKEIDEVIKIVNDNYERVKNEQIPKRLQQEIGAINEYCESTKQTVTPSNALIEKPVKKGFFERLTDAFTENTDNWIREDVEENGTHMVIYKNEDGAERSRYEALEDSEENLKRENKAKKFGFFSRIRAAIKGEKKPQEEVDKKKSAIDKQFEEINETVTKGTQKYTEERQVRFTKEVVSEEYVALKPLMAKLEPKYEWAGKKKIELELRKQTIEQEIEQIESDSQIRIEKINELVDEINQQTKVLEEASKLAKELQGKTLSKEVEYKFMKGDFSDPKVIKALEELRGLQAKLKEAQERRRELEEEYDQNIGEKSETLKRAQEKLIEYEKIDKQKLNELEQELKRITMEQEKLEQRNSGPEK